MRILLVDDSQTMLSMTRSVVAAMGSHQIEEAANGQEALVKCAWFRPELILCDWSMPVLDGLGFVKALRRIDTATPVIMVSTEREPSSIAEAFAAGANQYVVKPFAPDLLRRRIQETLDRRSPRRAAA